MMNWGGEGVLVSYLISLLIFFISLPSEGGNPSSRLVLSRNASLGIVSRQFLTSNL